MGEPTGFIRSAQVHDPPINPSTYRRAGQVGHKIGLTRAQARRTIPPAHNRARAALESGTPSCRRRPLRHEGLATLALRKLNRQPSGVPPLWPLPPREQGCLAAYPQSPRQHASRSIEQQHNIKPVLDKEERNATLFGSMRTARMRTATYQIAAGQGRSSHSSTGVYTREKNSNRGKKTVTCVDPTLRVCT